MWSTITLVATSGPCAYCSCQTVQLVRSRVLMSAASDTQPDKNHAANVVIVARNPVTRSSCYATALVLFHSSRIAIGIDKLKHQMSHNARGGLQPVSDRQDNRFNRLSYTPGPQPKTAAAFSSPTSSTYDILSDGAISYCGCDRPDSPAYLYGLPVTAVKSVRFGGRLCSQTGPAHQKRHDFNSICSLLFPVRNYTIASALFARWDPSLSILLSCQVARSLDGKRSVDW